MSHFFIDRPVFAWVIAIAVVLAGVVSIRQLAVEQYPNVAVPAINVSATYPGASAKTVENSVIQVIEQQLTGLDHLRYMESSSDSTGGATITLTFDGGTDPDIAQVQVQNKLQNATSLLPQEVQSQGIRVAKSSGSMLLLLALVSEDGSMSTADLSDYLVGTLQEPISRITGVGQVQTFGSQYAMRIWLDPDKLVQFKLTSQDVSAAIQAQNVQISAGSIGAQPAVKGQLLEATMVTRGRLASVQEFQTILVRMNPDGSRILLGDVARIELGSESYNQSSRYNGKPASGMMISASSGANALSTVEAVRSKMAELEPTLPKGVRVIYPVDSTPFVNHSIREVVKTLIEAVILVFVVMYVFLGSIRATIIPTIAVPVVVLGTFGVLYVTGFSINTLTLFGMVLAIGLLVDDAIVVVENVERVMEEEGLSPRDATRKSMGQISGALVGIGLVLCAAFVPMAFFGNSTGVIYRQFAVTMASSVALSVAVALILTPALCATFLKPTRKGALHQQRGWFGWFNRFFNRTADRYANMVEHTLHHSWRLLAVYGIIIVGVVIMYRHLPTSFLPEEDKGMLFAMADLPPGSTTEQTLAVLDEMDHVFRENMKDSVEGVMTIAGFGLSGAGQNQGAMFAKLKDWSERTAPSQQVQAIQGRAMGAFMQFKNASVFALVPPAVQELGNTSGFDLRLIDSAGLGHEALVQAQSELIRLASENSSLQGVRANSLADKAGLLLTVDIEKAGALGLDLRAVNTELSTVFGSMYVNDFIDKGRVKKVYLQGDAAFRMTPEDLGRWHARNSNGEMVPLSSFVSMTWEMSSPKLSRFNGMPSLAIAGQAAVGYSSGQAMAEMERLVKQLPAGIGYQWAGLSYEERLSGSNSGSLYALALILVFLCLAALYENWAIPVSVLMDIPLGALGVLAACTIRSMPNDIYFQIGLITIIGLSAKNAILVVEFAKERYDAGETLFEATKYAVRQRLRPIMMTSIAFGLGVLPLALSTGPGAASQNAVGTGVLGGAITTTLLGLFFVPLYFVTVLRLFRVKPKRRYDDTPASPTPSVGHNINPLAAITGCSAEVVQI